MRALHQALAGHAGTDNPAHDSVAQRLSLAGVAVGQNNRIHTAPPINRMSMVPQSWGSLNPLVRCFRTLTLSG